MIYWITFIRSALSLVQTQSNTKLQAHVHHLVFTVLEARPLAWNPASCRSKAIQESMAKLPWKLAAQTAPYLMTGERADDTPTPQSLLVASVEK